MSETSVTKFDSQLAYLTRKLDLYEQALALKERELALRERSLEMRREEIEHDRQHEAEVDGALDSLRERLGAAANGEMARRTRGRA